MGLYDTWVGRQLQNYDTDHYAVLWDRQRRYLIRALAAEHQPDGFVVPRAVLTGPRAGYVLSAIRFSLAPLKVFPIVAEGTAQVKLEAAGHAPVQHGRSSAEERAERHRVF